MEAKGFISISNHQIIFSFLISVVCCRERIVKENGVSLIEYFSFEEHDQLKLASTECLCNMVMNEKVNDLFFTMFFHLNKELPPSHT